MILLYFFPSRRRHTRCGRDWSSDVCSSDLKLARGMLEVVGADELVVIANTGDDIEIYNAYVSPDPDLITFWLADQIGRASCRERESMAGVGVCFERRR